MYAIGIGEEASVQHLQQLAYGSEDTSVNDQQSDDNAEDSSPNDPHLDDYGKEDSKQFNTITLESKQKEGQTVAENKKAATNQNTQTNDNIGDTKQEQEQGRVH